MYELCAREQPRIPEAVRGFRDFSLYEGGDAAKTFHGRAPFVDPRRRRERREGPPSLCVVPRCAQGRQATHLSALSVFIRVGLCPLSVAFICGLYPWPWAVAGISRVVTSRGLRARGPAPLRGCCPRRGPRGCRPPPTTSG